MPEGREVPRRERSPAGAAVPRRLRGHTARILDSPDPMSGNTIAVDAADLFSLHDRVARLDALARRRGRQVRALLVAGGALLALGVCVGTGFSQLRQQLSSCHARLIEYHHESSALAAANEVPHRAATREAVRALRRAGGGTGV